MNFLSRIVRGVSDWYGMTKSLSTLDTVSAPSAAPELGVGTPSEPTPLETSTLTENLPRGLDITEEDNIPCDEGYWLFDC